MKRIPYSTPDLKKLPDIGRRLVHNVQGFTTSNRDKLAEFVAKASFYTGLHDLKAELGKTPIPQPGSIKRVDVQTAFALGLRKLTGLSLVDAFRRAGRSKLGLLSIDRLTVEYLQEEKIREWQLSHPDKHIAMDEAHKLLNHDNGWHKDGALLKSCGAPGFGLAVRKDGMAFQWSQFTGLYDALLASKELSAITDRDLTALSNDEAVDLVVREVLVPESWIPLRDLIRDGLWVPHHEVIWLFDESGSSIGRVIRHAVHKGIVPRVLLTDDEVVETLSNLMMGKFVGQGSSLADNIGPIRGDASVYTLKLGFPAPKSVVDPLEAPSVPVEALDLLPGIKGGSMTLHTGARQRSVWYLDGQYVRNTSDHWSGLRTGYLVTESWLSELDFPRLYPHHIAPAVSDRAHDLDLKVVLPPSAVSFQVRASNLLRREIKAARKRLASAGESGELLARVNRTVDRVAIEAAAERMFQARFLVDTDEVFSESDHVQAQADQDARKEDELRLLSETVERLGQRFPALSNFGSFSLCFALMALHGSLGEADAEDESLEEVMSELVVLAGGTAAKQEEIDYFRAEQTAVAVGLWLDGMIKLEDVPAVASEYQVYTWRLERQGQKIERIKTALIDEKDRSDHAKELGFAYVSRPVPMTKPMTTAEFLSSQSYPRKTNTAVQSIKDFHS